MKVLFLSRSTLYTVFGGDTVQIEATAKYLRRLGVGVDIRLSDERIDYRAYDLIHYFNIIRPADILPHISRSGKPYVVSTIFVDYSEFETAHRRGLPAIAGPVFGANGLEYLKTIARWVKNGESVRSMKYLLHGHRSSICAIAAGAKALLPNSESEYRRFEDQFHTGAPYRVIPNAIDPELFHYSEEQVRAGRDPREVICVSRIEGKKNQLNLIQALNGTEFRLSLIGKPAPNHMGYYRECRRIAGANIRFLDFMPAGDLGAHYLKAKVHVLPSWNETCGLSSLEAAYAGCNIVVTDRGDTTDYYASDAWYCEPGNPESIYEAVKAAARAPVAPALRERIARSFTWEETARRTLDAYEEVLHVRALTADCI